MKVVQHVVSSIDTIQSIAAQYYGDASKWHDLVDFNNLDYPYITTDPSFQSSTYASGIVTVTRTYSANAITIPKGTRFLYPGIDGFPDRVYLSMQTVTLGIGTLTAQVSVQCTVAGTWGNVPQNVITAISAPGTTLQTAFSRITNASTFTNGIVLNVRKLGDALLVPVESGTNRTASYGTITDFYTQVFGEDITLGADGDLTFDAYGDIGSTAGIQNLAQAARDRLLTPKKSLSYHPEYGSLLEQYVATAAPGYVDKMIALTIEETLQEDDRIFSATVTDITTSGTLKNVTVVIVPINQGDPVSFTFAVPSLIN